jgi:hypothetical protein
LFGAGLSGPDFTARLSRSRHSLRLFYPMQPYSPACESRGKLDFYQLAISAPAWIGPVQTARRSTMDLFYIGLIAAFVAVSIALVYGFDKLKERP